MKRKTYFLCNVIISVSGLLSIERKNQILSSKKKRKRKGNETF